jgi:hypothetical protein
MNQNSGNLLAASVDVSFERTQRCHNQRTALISTNRPPATLEFALKPDSALGVHCPSRLWRLWKASGRLS